MANGVCLECQVCGFVGFDDGLDGFFYCQRCGSQAEGLRDTAVDNDEILLTKENAGATYQRRVTVIKAEPLSQSQPQSQFWETLKTQDDDDDFDPDDPNDPDYLGPTEPADFGRRTSEVSYEKCYSEIRMRYVMGFQIMIEMQIKALVEKFNVSPIIVDMVEPIWLRFLASTKVMSDTWAEKVIEESESQVEGVTEGKAIRPEFIHEPHNILGKRCVVLWLESLHKTIPIFYSLAISFLVCHLAREPILTTDILKWALEGKLLYFAAFLEIEKQIGPPTDACPFTSCRLFRPKIMIRLQKLEACAALIAQSIGLELPPVNFHAIATRYLKQLSLPVDIILPHACRIVEWAMPPELWLSANRSRFPTRAFVLSILIVSVRILCDINGFGNWEMSLSGAEKRKPRKIKDKKKSNVKSADELSQKSGSKSESDVDDSAAKPYNKPVLDATEILVLLDSKYSELLDTTDHGKDLGKYLEYCKDTIFAGVELPFDDYEEDKLIEDLWDFYKKEDHKSSESYSSPHKKSKDDKNDEIVLSHQDREIKRIKSNMEENKFCYVPPRKTVRVNDYLHYRRRRDAGAYVYSAHADYYILLRSFARVAQLDIRGMHAGVLAFERRLDWLEKLIGHSLKKGLCNEPCQFCLDDNDGNSMDIS